MQAQQITKPFRKQFFELISGSVMAQIFSLLLMPVVSRLYTPAEVGQFALYVAISSIIGIMATLRFDLAIVLARDDDEAANLVWLSFACALLIALLSLLGMSVGFPLDTFLAMTVLSIFAIGSVQALLNWHSRHQNYKVLATRNAGEKLIVLALSVVLGYWGYTQSGLIVGQALGLLFSLVYFFVVSGLPKLNFNYPEWRDTFRHFADFPIKNLPSTSLMVLSLFLPSILFAQFFSKADLGQFNLSSRAFEIPINLIGYTFSTVYYRHASGVAAADRHRLFRQSLRLLTLIFVPAFLVLVLIGPPLFEWFFGEPWRQAGEMARWIAPYTCARLLFVSQAPLLLVERKLSLDLVISAFLLIAQLAGFAIGYFGYNDLFACVAWMSALSGIMFLIGLQRIGATLKKGALA